MGLTTYLLLMSFKLLASNAYLQIFHERKNWFEAKNECVIRGGRLADPDELNPNACANESINIWLNKVSNERLTPWIANMGCYNNPKQRFSKNPRLACYQSCSTTPFGYKQPFCSCEDATTVGFIAPSPCLSDNMNVLWLYNSTQIDLRDDDYTMDCITAQCTDNGTIHKAVNCSSKRLAKCQLLGSSFNISEKDTQTNSEDNCYKRSAYLISNQVCTALGNSDKNSPEFWTGIKRYRYKITGNDVDKSEVQNSDIINCVYGRCPIDSAIVKYTKNCRHKQDGFACIFNDTSDNITTVKPSSESLLPPSFISASLASSFYIEATSSLLQLLSNHASTHIVSSSINTRSPSANHNDISTQAYSTNIKTFDKVTEWSENNTLQSTPSRDSNTKSFNHNTDTSNSENMFPQLVITTSEISSKNVPQQSSIETNIHEGIKSSVSTYLQSNKESSILQTSITSEFVLINESKYEVVNTSIITFLTSTKHDNIDIPTKVPPTFPVETSLGMKNSVVMQTQSNIGSSMLQTSALMYSQSKISSSTSVTLDITTALYSLIVKNKSATESNGGKRKNSSTTSYQNDKSRNQQLSTGLIVGISVSILCLFVLIIGTFGICRLRNQRAFKEKSLDFPSPINTMSQYQDIDSNSKKDTQIIEKDLTDPVVSATDDDKPFRLTDKTSNGDTNKPNDPYATVMKKPVTTKADNTSNSKTIKSDIAHDEYSVVMKVLKKDMDKDEQTSLDVPESNYDSMNQPRPISDNESGNIYNTSIGHRDDTDPTYHTTTHIKTREEKYESDYDHL